MVMLYHSPLFEHIRTYLLNVSQHETIFLFVPYIHADVLAKLLNGIENSIVIVTTWEPTDLLSGASDISVYPYCQARGITLYVSEMMHLKVYSIGLNSAILATGNISYRGLMPKGNYEAAVYIEHLTNEDRLFFNTIQKNARLVDDDMYLKLKDWVRLNVIGVPKLPTLKDMIPPLSREDFLVSALPMTYSVDVLVAGYGMIRAGQDPSDNSEVAACIFHDLANYSIPLGLSDDEFRRELSNRFFAHPFICKMDEFIAPEAYFGRIKEWIQNNCTDVPVPSRRELTGNVQVLLEWFVSLGNGRYVVDIPGARSQRISKVTHID
ncbi:MAG: phosphatidylserine/phosphatidylglycerophosphate/cardiolipin synthase family protein [Cenarchaeum sp. SB0665_bin_23]|nr:phosphatidylserine/phosphatidylglycerophosphate/cardiolipin synthase family protein [Cenarchaeum sp. SB0665_bin_23]MYB46250.1 phosphatidylserine/phosphatidylglycerophosphate/cardiolipin synthase family protein [Cenarchaeum sp. SB0662_bin_33]MYG33569.1 phosphatidylserine/phosphatidylglycerophosphate/cardiolipin synthase family protein [Cenarchaeum sp. SB0677_bin_16]